MPSQYRISYDFDNGNQSYSGQGASQGDSPIIISRPAFDGDPVESFYLTGLPPCSDIFVAIQPLVGTDSVGPTTRARFHTGGCGPTGRFESSGRIRLAGGNGVGPEKTLVGDWNDDGLVDAISVHPCRFCGIGGGSVQLHVGSGVGEFHETFPSGFLVSDDPTQDYAGVRDVAVVHKAGGEGIALAVLDLSGMFLFAFDETGLFTNEDPLFLPLNSRPERMIAIELDGDSGAEIAVLETDGAALTLVDVSTSGLDVIIRRLLPKPPQSLATLDFNRDNIADIAVTVSDGAESSLLLLEGVGADGIWSGEFVEHTYDLGSTNVADCAVGDLLEDGYPDLAIALPSLGAVRIFTSQEPAASGFGPSISFASGPSPVGIAISDVDGDHVEDIVVTNRVGLQGGRGGYTALLGTPLSGTQGNGALGSGQFVLGRSTTVADDVVGITIGDVNADGLSDLVVTARNRDLAPAGDGVFLEFGAGSVGRAGSVSFLANESIRRGLPTPSNGSFLPARDSRGTFDYNNDSIADSLSIFRGGVGSDTYYLSVAISRGIQGQPFGSLGWGLRTQLGRIKDYAYVNWTAGASPSLVVLLDADGPTGDEVVIFDASGGAEYWSGTVPESRCLTIFDSNRDGLSDLVLVGDQFGYIYPATGSSGMIEEFADVPLRIDLPIGAKGLCQMGDLDGDRVGDMIFATGTGFSVGLGPNFNFQTFGLAGGVSSLMFRDLDQDGYDDIVVQSGARISTVNGNAGGTISETVHTLPTGGTATPPGLAFTDWNHDGTDDIIARSDEALVVLMSTSGLNYAATSVALPEPGQWRVAGWEDISGDYFPDLLLCTKDMWAWAYGSASIAE